MTSPIISQWGNWANAYCSEWTHKITHIPSRSPFHMHSLMFWALLLVRGPSERSSEVTPGHSGSWAVFDNNSLQIEDREAKLPPLCLSRRDASTDVQHDIPGSPCDLDLWSNIQLDLLRLLCMSFEPPWRGEHDAVNISSLSWSHKLFGKFHFRKKSMI